MDNHATTIGRPSLRRLPENRYRLTDKQAIAFGQLIAGPIRFAVEADCTKKNIKMLVGILRCAPRRHL